MPVSYSNTIAQLFGILPSHQQRDCPCHYCTCLCHRRKGTTESYTTRKDYPRRHGPSPLRQKLQLTPAGESHREENAGENLAVQTTGPQAVDSGRNSTTSHKSDKPGGGGESKSEKEDSEEEEFDNSSGDSEPSKHAQLNKVEEEGVASGIRQLIL